MFYYICDKLAYNMFRPESVVSRYVIYIKTYLVVIDSIFSPVNESLVIKPEDNECFRTTAISLFYVL